MNKIMAPWTPMKAYEDDRICKAAMWGREYTVENNVLFTSMTSLGEELLHAPMKLVALENGGKQSVWQEQTSFLMSSTEENIVICGSQQSDTFVINTALNIEFDGCCDIDIKVMPRGKTVQEVFGVSEIKPNPYSLERLWLEIPLKKKHAKNFHYYPSHEGLPTFEGKGIEPSEVCMSREIPSSMAMPFKPLVWLGTEDRGLCFFADNDKNWEPENVNRAIEIIDDGDILTLRLHLIDGQVKAWREVPGRARNYTYSPISFRIGLQATPVKPFPENPYKEKILHIDCFKKILIEYNDFLKNPVVEGDTEIGYDRMKRLGVTTLVIHEKWNKIQNYWELQNDTALRTREIIRECHARGIKVIPYFGYEISSLSPLWHELGERVTRKMVDGIICGGWYRKPNQRDYSVCYGSEWAELMAQGLAQMTEEFGFDGVYLDGTIFPYACHNNEHGCGFYDFDGKAHPTYQVSSTRRFMKKLYAFYEPRGGMINTHISNCCNIPSLSFSHLNWDGEYVQNYVNKNGIECLPMDYLRTEYSARNFGTPYELLVYTFDNWSFRDGMSVALIHGMLPRPNDIGEPLEIMSPIWAAIDRFPIAQSVWKPYWANEAVCNNKSVYVSYYEHTAPDGEKSYLIFMANPTDSPAESVSLTIGDEKAEMVDVVLEKHVTFPVNMKTRDTRIFTLGG